MNRYLQKIRKSKRVDHAGNKAQGLRFLLRRGFPVPAAHVCVWDAFEAYRAGDTVVLSRIRSELSRLLQEDRSYAVRSSANLEDAVHRSLAGQFRSVLGVRGPDEALAAILSVWDSCGGPDESSLPGLKMAVVVQEMVPAVVSGIAFSCNPVTGRKEILLEAVRGSGESLQQAGVTHLRWVHRRGRWAQRAEEGSIPEEVLEELVRSIIRIEAAHGSPVDVEWVFDGRSLHYVQVRGITAVDEPIYSCKISREMLPGLIKPLVWSVNTSLINPVWTDILTRLSGDRSIRPEDLTGRFYARAYFNMNPFGKVFARLGMPKEALELLIGVEEDAGGRSSRMTGMKPGHRALLRIPAFLAFAAELLSIERPLLRFLPRMKSRYDAIADIDPADLDGSGVRKGIVLLQDLTLETARFSILIPLLALMYARSLLGVLKKSGVDPQDVDMEGEFAEVEEIRPTSRLERLRSLYDAADPPSEAFLRESRRFLSDFGHFSDSGNDFSSTPWREMPDVVLDMVRMASPRSERRTGLRSIASLHLPYPRRALVRLLLPRARRFAVHRERISSLYTFGYGQFRRFYLSIGERFVRNGILDRKEDVFFLDKDEVDRIVDGTDADGDWRGIVEERKAELEEARSVQPPDVVFGNTAPPVVSWIGTTLQGVPTSRGSYTGTVRVLHGLSDAGKLQPGDVLVIPFSDVGWTPLFVHAGAVVAESGGILSHSSIVAREMGIPAVVSVPMACRLVDGTTVTVDGFRGEVRVHEEEPVGPEGDRT